MIRQREYSGCSVRVRRDRGPWNGNGEAKTRHGLRHVVARFARAREQRQVNGHGKSTAYVMLHPATPGGRRTGYATLTPRYARPGAVRRRTLGRARQRARRTALGLRYAPLGLRYFPDLASIIQLWAKSATATDPNASTVPLAAHPAKTNAGSVASQ